MIELAGGGSSQPAPALASCGAVLYAKANRSRTHGKPSASGVDTGMMTFHEWLAEQRRMREGLWLGDDKLAIPGMSNINPLGCYQGL